MTFIPRSQRAIAAIAGVLVFAGLGWAVYRVTVPTADPRGFGTGPPSTAKPGTPCMQARKVPVKRLTSLRRNFRVLIPTDKKDLGRFMTGWTCGPVSGVVLQYDSGVLIREEDGSPFLRDRGGALGYFSNSVDQDGGMAVRVDGFPGLARDAVAHSENRGSVQFIGQDDFLFIGGNGTIPTRRLMKIAENMARQVS